MSGVTPARQDFNKVADPLAAPRLVDVHPLARLEERGHRQELSVFLEHPDERSAPHPPAAVLSAV